MSFSSGNSFTSADIGRYIYALQTKPLRALVAGEVYEITSLVNDQEAKHESTTGAGIRSAHHLSQWRFATAQEISSSGSGSSSSSSSSSDILGQIGEKVGQEFKKVSNQFLGLTGSDNYSEIAYDSSGNVSSVSTYTDNTKSTLIKIKTLTYTNGQLSQIVVEDGINAQAQTVLTQTISYDSSGNLTSIEKDYA